MLEYKDTEIEGEIDVLPDPRFDIPTGDREAAWAAVQRAGALQESVTEAVQRILDLSLLLLILGLLVLLILELLSCIDPLTKHVNGLGQV